MIPQSSITLVGAGLVGSLLSIFLKRKGHNVKIYERRPDIRKTQQSAGRSINLALSDRGFKALRAAGIEDGIRAIGIPMYGRQVHDKQGNEQFQAYGLKHQAIYSVSRAGLNARLITLAEQEGVPIYFEHRCESVQLQNAGATFVNAYQERISTTADILLGADGAYSQVRNAMQTQPRFNYSQYYIEYGYKELSIAPKADGTHALAPNALHIWPRKEFMLIALPNIDGSFTCTLFFPFNGPMSFESLRTDHEVETFFKEHFADVIPLMPDYLEQFRQNAASAMVTVRCFPWSWEGRSLLIGDAAHAIVPFYGQGMNAGFEDCVVFNQLMEQENNWSMLMQRFENERKPNADAIAQLALNNFIEMRDKVADEDFLLQKKMEAWFSAKHPDKWVPLYSMVTFRDDISYADALAKGKRQDEIMQQILQMPEARSHKWDSPTIEQAILSRL